MCLIGIRLESGSAGSFQIAANRDEFSDRPTQAMHWWRNGILAGRDLKAGGTWLGLSRTGRVAAVTNVRDPLIRDNPCPRSSRGHLVTEFLLSDSSPEHFAALILESLEAPSPFNLLVGQVGRNHAEFWWLGGRTQTLAQLVPGAHSISNAELNTPWPKAVALQRAMQSGIPDQIESLLQSRETARDTDLPNTGVSQEWERRLSAPMITGVDYHTRSSTLITLAAGVVQARETTWGPDGRALGLFKDQFNLA